MPGRSELPVAVVTGGNRGVGLEVCRRLVNLGFAVVLGSRDLRRAEIAAKEIGEWVKDRFGRVDAIVNNASTAPDLWAMAGNTDLSPVAEALDINLFGAWRVTHALLPLLRSSSRPRIVNVSSEGGSIARITGGRPAYTVSKAALNALTRMLAAELYRDGVLVNAVCPGWTAQESGGGSGGGRTEGAASVVWAVTIPNGGPTGTFTRDGRELPW